MEVINQEKEQLSSILTSMTDAVITFNKDFTVLVSNPQADKLFQKWYANNVEQKILSIYRRSYIICLSMYSM